MALLLATLPSGAWADRSPLRVEAGARVITFGPEDVARIGFGTTSSDAPLLELWLAPSRIDDWLLFTTDTVGELVWFVLCGELVGGMEVASPRPEGYLSIPAGYGVERVRRLALFRGEATCDAPSS